MTSFLPSYLGYTLLFCTPLLVYLWMRKGFFVILKQHIRAITYATLTWTIAGPVLWQIAMSMRAWEYVGETRTVLFGAIVLEDIVWWACIGLLFSSFWVLSTHYEKRGKDFVYAEIQGLCMSFVYACKGFSVLFHERNFTIHIIAALAVTSVGFSFRITQAEWYWVIAWITLVFAAEFFNSALERLTAKIENDFTRDIGFIKDVSAGAVLVVSIGAAITGIMIFAPKIAALI